MNDSNAEKNKAIVLEAFDTLFNKRDYSAAERFWSPNYIQYWKHSIPCSINATTQRRSGSGLPTTFNTAPISSRDETGSSISSRAFRQR